MVMKIRTLNRHIREGIKNFARNGWMTFAAVTSVATTLLILGVFLLLSLNVNFITKIIEDQVEIRVLLELTSGEEEKRTIEQKLQSILEIERITFISKKDGIEQFIDSLGEQGRYFLGLNEENPLPDIYVIKTSTPQETEKTAKLIEQFEHVYKVNYGAGTIEKLFDVTNMIRNIGFIFIVGLAFTAMLLISNTIKITIIARSNEIEIMKLVGGTNSFIRWPFFIEGLLLGVVGAIIPIAILVFGYQQLLNSIGNDLKFNIIMLLPMDPLMYQISPLLLGIGTLIGVWGSMISVRRFLQI